MDFLSQIMNIAGIGGQRNQRQGAISRYLGGQQQGQDTLPPQDGGGAWGPSMSGDGSYTRSLSGGMTADAINSKLRTLKGINLGQQQGTYTNKIGDFQRPYFPNATFQY